LTPPHLSKNEPSLPGLGDADVARSRRRRVISTVGLVAAKGIGRAGELIDMAGNDAALPEISKTICRSNALSSQRPVPAVNAVA